MINRSQSSMGGFPEHNERLTQQAEIEPSTAGLSEEQALLDHLLERGFVWEEAAKLLNLRDHLYENTEIRQRVADDARMHFARWLYEQGTLNESD